MVFSMGFHKQKGCFYEIWCRYLAMGTDGIHGIYLDFIGLHWGHRATNVYFGTTRILNGIKWYLSDIMQKYHQHFFDHQNTDSGAALSFLFMMCKPIQLRIYVAYTSSSKYWNQFERFWVLPIQRGDFWSFLWKLLPQGISTQRRTAGDWCQVLRTPKWQNDET